jgi:glyoxylase-like metal-dependent hydrolase (beta-lactamase superfamily II)
MLKEVVTVIVQRIHPGMFSIATVFEAPGITVFLYLLKGERVALIDTGAAHSPREVIEPALAEVGLALSDVDLILNTHGHLDHAGGNLETKRISNATIHMHSEDLFMVQSTEALVDFMNAPVRTLEFPQEVVEERAARTRKHAGDPAGADVTLADGDVVDLGAGINLHVVHIPGHSPGSVAYYWEREGVLITGDAVQGQGSRIGNCPLYYSAPDYRRSLTKLDALDFRMLCLGHAFYGGTLLNEPIRTGIGGRMFVQESIRVADSIDRTVAMTMQRMPGASQREIALATVPELVHEVPLLVDRRSGMPRAGGPTIAAHIQAVLEGSYPA